jgi:dienelactone hydrolase
MLNSLKPWILTAAAALLAACTGSSSTTPAPSMSTTRGTLSENPPFRVASANAATFQAQISAIKTGPLTGAELLQITGNPVCGVDFYYLTFWTVGGAGETTESSGALMVPTGAAPTCSGPRPIVLYAHATQFLKSFNIADITDTTNNAEGALIAAAFAAQGFIVVAPNFAGYDISTLGYHPYLNAVQQSGEMLDILAAARTALPNTLSSATSDSGKLFLTGYSAGGHAAMATQRALIKAGATVTAAAPMSGPYALEAYFDTVVLGDVPVAATLFTPLVTTSWQHEYDNLYTATTDLYAAPYATGIDTLLPSDTPYQTIVADGLLPANTFLNALFDSTTPTAATVLADTGSAPLAAELPAVLLPPPTPLLAANLLTPIFDLGFSSPYLIQNSYRILYAADALTNPDPALAGTGTSLPATAPTQPLRLAAYKNDMRSGWAPNSPTLLCGGDSDPTIFFQVNALAMQAYWSGLPAGLVTVLDVNGTPSGPFAPYQIGFQEAQAASLASYVTYYESAAGGSLPAAQALQAAEGQVVGGTHKAEAPFCTAAVSKFFSSILNGG